VGGFWGGPELRNRRERGLVREEAIENMAATLLTTPGGTKEGTLLMGRKT